MRECWLKDNCNQKDCENEFCMKFFKLNFLYDSAMISDLQRKHVSLRIDSDESDRDAFEILKGIENNIEQFVDNGGNVYIHSIIPGNGKTSWSLRLVEAYFNKIWAKSSLSCRALFINVPRFLLAIKDNISKQSDYIEHIKANVLNCDIVIWDDVGTKGLTEFEHENVLNLINARIDSGKSNIYSSNLRDNELHKAVGDRLYSRIVNMSTCIELRGKDKRGI